MTDYSRPPAVRILITLGAALALFATTLLPGVATDADASFERMPNHGGIACESPTIVSNAATVDGTPGDDVIVGGPASQTIRGFGGNDIICAGGGNDTIYGDHGNDQIMGGSGNDVIDGGAHDDTIWGGHGYDIITGGHGSDFIYGNQGPDVIIGGSGVDYLSGGWGDDYVDGGTGDDHLFGGPENDEIAAGDGRDSIYDDFMVSKSQGDALTSAMTPPNHHENGWTYRRNVAGEIITAQINEDMIKPEQYWGPGEHWNGSVWWK